MLFATSRHGRLAITGKLILAYLGVSVLHGLWDSMHSIALYLTLVLTEGERLRPSPQGWPVGPSAEQVNLFSIMEWGRFGGRLDHRDRLAGRPLAPAEPAGS
jgi:hypothetical protein